MAQTHKQVAPTHERFLNDALVVRQDLHDRKPRWMDKVVATGFGPKLVDGYATDEPAVHFFLKTKRPNKSVARMLRVPKSIEGLTTDVISSDSGVALTALSFPADAVSIGYGYPISSSDGERGTVTCSAVANTGEAVLVTAAHYVTEGRDVRDDSGINTYGRVRNKTELLSADDLYPGLGAGNRPCRVDFAVIDPAPGIVPRGGLPGGASFVVQPWQTTYTWMMDKANAGQYAPAATFGALHHNSPRTQPGWRQGVVTTLLPQVVVDGITYFCAIFDNGKSFRGDSGSLWIGHQDDGSYPAIGIHYGVMNTIQRHVLVSDISAALPHVGIQQLLGTSG